MKAQTLLLTLFGILISYLVLDVRFEQKSDAETKFQLNKSLATLLDTLPKYIVEKDGIITPKGMKYHILITPPDTTQNWKIPQMLIEKTQKFHMLLPEIE
ncbi:MAG: hypothetical protein AAF806_14455 [Bacteroidota bacterium]